MHSKQIINSPVTILPADDLSYNTLILDVHNDLPRVLHLPYQQEHNTPEGFHTFPVKMVNAFWMSCPVLAVYASIASSATTTLPYLLSNTNSTTYSSPIKIPTTSRPTTTILQANNYLGTTLPKLKSPSQY